MNRTALALTIVLLSGSPMCAFATRADDKAAPSKLVYPASPKGDTVDDYFGTKVADPYRWLEDDNADATKQWVIAQNKVTFDYLGTIPQRKAIADRITKLWNFEKFGTPGKEGGLYFYSYNSGLEPQARVMFSKSLSEAGKVLIDPNTLRADGTAALAGMAITDDGKLMAYGVADAGSDWNTWKVRDIATGNDLSDEVKWAKFSGASWTKDGKGFFYSRFDAPQEGKALTGSNKYQKVYYHAVGTKQEQDVLVYQRPDQADWGFGATVTDDGQYVAMNVSYGTDKKNRFFYRDLKTNPIGAAPTAQDESVSEIERAIKTATENKDAMATTASTREREAMLKSNGGMAHGFVELLNDFDASYDFIDNVGTKFYFLNDSNAPRNQVLMIDVASSAKENWKVVVPSDPSATMISATIVGDHIICNYLQDARSAVKVYDLSGKFVRDVDLPGIGTASGFGGKRSDPETFYSFTGFTTPPSVFRYDVRTGQSTLYKAAKVDFNPGDFETKQVFYTSKDGTKVPMFITHRKGMSLDGNNPTLLYGYGGFNIPLTPSFSVANLVWMEMGGVYAVANIRGGGEYGETWHQGGTKLNKQNVFDDFIAAGEWLNSNGYSNPKKLAIMGGSNGGLLVGACMTQRPDLFAAAIPQVGVMDMLRFHKFTIGHAWRSDYGSSENQAEFEKLNSYSPYHALLRAKPGSKYPATMVTTADHDDRVVPGHSFKFAAALQAAHTGDTPALIRVETRAGHGAGMPTSKRIELSADIFGFLFKNLNMDPSKVPGTSGAMVPAAGEEQAMEFAVEGMMCSMCEGKVVKACKALPGVKTAVADHAKGSLKVTLDSGAKVEKDAVVAALSAIKFPAKAK
jgi:prolyl oligopeptidase